MNQEARKEKYKEACMLMTDCVRKLTSASAKLDIGSFEFQKLMSVTVLLSEPLARAKAQCDFQEWMYDEWKSDQQDAQLQ